MSIRTSPLTQPSSSFGQQTPALTHTGKRLYDDDGFPCSSSPLNELIATPTDGHRFGRGRTSKAGITRRSVRIHPTSSPPPRLDTRFASIAYDDDSDFAAPSNPPSRPRNQRTASHQGLSKDVEMAPTRAEVARTATSARSKSANGVPSPAKSTTLALAQAHGITADQFEEAKQQVMRFLQNDGSHHSPSSLEQASAQLAAASSAMGIDYLMTTPVHSQVPPLQARASRSHATLSMTASGSKRSRNAFESIGETHEADRNDEDLEDLEGERGVSNHELKTHPSFEDIVQRSQRREEDTRESQVRKWAQEDSSSEEDEPFPESRQATSTLVSASVSTSRLPSGASLLPSPSFIGGNAQHATSPLGAASLPRRGMMERFMSDRTPAVLPEEPSSAIGSDKAPSSAPRRRVVSSPATSPAASRPRPIDSTMSPPRRLPNISPDRLMTSPAPSRGRAPSLLFSPDIAKLLRSELDELEAMEKKPTPRKQRAAAARAADMMTVADLSSPFSDASTPLSSSAGNSSGAVNVANAPWPQHGAEQAFSPSPSLASLRAPSFCDSSPPVSDGASAAGGSSFAVSYQLQPHPTSAPDHLFRGLPSSSPVSSQASQLSEYQPAQPRGHRSSPGPTMLSKQGGASSGASHALVSANLNLGARSRNTPIHRADTMPAIMSADGHAKPHWSYAALIGQAIFSTEDRKISLADIYAYIMACYPYYKKEDAGWQNSIRHNLSLNECFVKTAREPDNPGKGCLWAIVPGCADQFADGGFTKKGGSTSNRRPRSAKAIAAALAESGDVSTDLASSPPNATTTHSTSAPKKRTRVESPGPMAPRRPSTVAIAPASSARPQAIRSLSAMEPDRALSPPVNLAPPRPSIAMSRSQSAIGIGSAEPRSRSLLVRRSSIDAKVLATAVPCAELSKDKPHNANLEAPYAPRPTMTRASPPPALQQQRRQSLVASLTASPPTSVYHRLAGPYQPISYTQSMTDHRALALLASPEATGIMPSHSTRDRVRPSGHALSSLLANPEQDVAPFLSGPHVFSSHAATVRARSRSNSSDKEEREPAAIMSPAAIVHTHSPVSSIRGGGVVRAPTSPVQTSEDKFAFSADPEKKRLPGMRHIPAVAALADGAASHAFRSPPPYSARHVRSPSGRAHSSAGGAFQSALLSTPLGVRSRASWGMSPGTGGGAGAGWGFDDSLEAELERFGGVADNVQTSGGSSIMPRLYWPSPSHPSSTATSHVAW
ncbi:BZ3500_MvSof-1268-A1-R1_Chr1-3g02236 [Microbotryum saponariae]|uniref:BZ3500_MvSof-1268-A1-R1_Chr1-3g02236 protein n=1 Tax=Microbotryum saponariae TaxID=289078 RepID=A0A2X0L519_9BASI|nr:BZ3500_MvSof-1268-A1-R1_Chr1-3g02236 [Microbotryum saponariae]SCZ95737.1 BZ3501_MvSof-1269-A2-R1_Chr1-3g01839 [Microbotryum saponariae]